MLVCLLRSKGLNLLSSTYLFRNIDLSFHIPSNHCWVTLRRKFGKLLWWLTIKTLFVSGGAGRATNNSHKLMYTVTSVAFNPVDDLIKGLIWCYCGLKLWQLTSKIELAQTKNFINVRAMNSEISNTPTLIHMRKGNNAKELCAKASIIYLSIKWYLITFLNMLWIQSEKHYVVEFFNCACLEPDQPDRLFDHALKDLERQTTCLDDWPLIYSGASSLLPHVIKLGQVNDPFHYKI